MPYNWIQDELKNLFTNLLCVIWKLKIDLGNTKSEVYKFWWKIWAFFQFVDIKDLISKFPIGSAGERESVRLFERDNV